MNNSKSCSNKVSKYFESRVHVEFQVLCSQLTCTWWLVAKCQVQISCDSRTKISELVVMKGSESTFRRTPKRPKRQKRKWPMTKVGLHSAWHVAWCNHLTSWPCTFLTLRDCKQVESGRRDTTWPRNLCVEIGEEFEPKNESTESWVFRSEVLMIYSQMV